jgi:hypothetical protein
VKLWEGPHDIDAAQADLLAAGVTDGLPVVPPTRARVARMLEANALDPGRVLTVLPPAYERTTCIDVAINAVMAGCLPEYLPVVIAAVEAIAAPEFNLQGIATTTGSACPLVVVNGPIVQRIAMNAGGNALGPGNRANACIGRALSLVLRNVGGALPGVMDMATLGQPAKYTCCFAENEANSPWSPLHVDRGVGREESAVTVFGIAGIAEIVDSASQTGADLAQTFAQSMAGGGNRGLSGLVGGGEALLIVPPEIADLFVRDGYTKQQAKEAIFARGSLPFAALAPRVREHMTKSGNAAAVLRIAHTADDVMIVVAGGAGIKTLHAQTWGGGTRAVTRRVHA